MQFFINLFFHSNLDLLIQILIIIVRALKFRRAGHVAVGIDNGALVWAGRC